jgi:hypothetical protein
MAATFAAKINADAALPRRTTRNEDLIAAVVGLWPVLGLYLDGWAHHTRPEMESFFTPWHGVLYSGAAAATVWLAILVLRRHTGGRSWREAIPPGYGLAVVGGLGFAAAGLGDMIWHTIFGVEADIEALLSPPHLLLFFSGLLTLSSPLRAAWLGRDERTGTGKLAGLLPALISLTSTTAVVAFFFHYLSPVQEAAAATSMGNNHAAARDLASIFVTNAILIGPLLFFIRAFGSPPQGAATILFTVVTALLVLDADFALAAAIPAAFASGLAVDALFRLVRPSAPEPQRFWLAAALAPIPLWVGYFLAVELTDGVAWSPELWSGAIFMTALIGLGLGFLSLPIRRASSDAVARRAGGGAVT